MATHSGSLQQIHLHHCYLLSTSSVLCGIRTWGHIVSDADENSCFGPIHPSFTQPPTAPWTPENAHHSQVATRRAFIVTMFMPSLSAYKGDDPIFPMSVSGVESVWCRLQSRTAHLACFHCSVSSCERHFRT